MATLQQFRTLHTVETCGGIHAAAKALHLSPSAVSQQVKALAAECGFPLLEPDGRGIRLTESGESVAQAVSQIAQLWEKAILRARPEVRAKRLQQPVVSLGSFPSAMANCVLPAFRSCAEYSVKVRLFETSPHEGCELVRNEILDAAVSLKDAVQTNEDGLHWLPLQHDPFVLVGPSGLLSSTARSRGASALSSLPWILPCAGSDCDRLISGHMARHGVRARPAGRTDDWSLAQEMAAALNAVAYIPSSVLRNECGLARVVDLAGIPNPFRTVVLVTRRPEEHKQWFSDMSRRFKQAYARTAGEAYSS
ncbi:LysR family transcriptional regulator [Streptomyces nanshensis]|uniref:LysR family transcriptional regulator n=1 Tax=Streptomyces nanshensis TaxID=518642 RepID=UPI00114D3C49|nr:LysR family transcriptional regulator [Streptomyces nanshensis]